MAYMNKNAELKNGTMPILTPLWTTWAPRWTWACFADGGGDTYVYEDAKKRWQSSCFPALSPMSGTARRWRPTGRTASTTMPTACWPAAARRSITAKAHSELYIQATVNRDAL